MDPVQPNPAVIHPQSEDTVLEDPNTYTFDYPQNDHSIDGGTSGTSQCNPVNIEDKTYRPPSNAQ